MSHFSHQLSLARLILSVCPSIVSLILASNNQPQTGYHLFTMVHICPICCAVCHSAQGLGKHIRSRFQCVSALGLLPKRAPKWKAASARPRNLQLNTQQALKSSVAPLWDDEDDNDDDSISPNNDLDDHLLKSTTLPPPPQNLPHFAPMAYLTSRYQKREKEHRRSNRQVAVKTMHSISNARPTMTHTPAFDSLNITPRSLRHCAY